MQHHLKNGKITKLSIVDTANTTLICNIITKSVGLKELELKFVDEEIMNALGTTVIPFVSINFGGNRRRTYDITPILVNPNIKYFETSMKCTYDPNVKVEILKFQHRDDTKYNDIREQCKINSETFRLARTKAIMLFE
jgi:hypothetical protein